MENRPKKLLDQVRDAIRVRHYARNTEQSYVYWINKYVPFHNKRHLCESKTWILSGGYGAVYLPFALAEKYPPANREWIWQYVFPSRSFSPDEQDGVIRRFHMSEEDLHPRAQPRPYAVRSPLDE